LNKAFFDAHVKARGETINNVHKQMVDSGEITYCFVFVDNKKSLDFRRGLLQDTCFVARKLDKNNKRVIGIALY
jgi:hypothetical protein